MNWEYINGTWYSNGRPSAVGPTQGTPYWTGSGRNRELRTFYGPESLPEVAGPLEPFAAANAPRGNGVNPSAGTFVDAIKNGTLPAGNMPTVTARPEWQPNPPGAYMPKAIPLPAPAITPQIVTGALAGNAPTTPTGMPPAPAYSNTNTVTNGRMSGRAYSNPDTPAPKGYNPELWDQRNIGIDRTLAAPMVTLGQSMGINAPSNTPTNLFQRQDFDGMGINENVADRNLLTSIHEVAKNGIAGSGIGKERANFILQALSNPAIVGNIARGNNASMKMMGGAPTNLIDRAGMIFDQQNNPTPRRIPEPAPDSASLMEDTEGTGWVPGEPGVDYNAPGALLGPNPVTTTTTAVPPQERARPRGMGDRRAPLNMNRRNERGAPIPRMANGTITSPGMSIPERILGTPRPMPTPGTGSVSSWPGQPAVNPPGYPNPQRTYFPPPRGQAALDRGNPMVLANPMSQMLRAIPRPARPSEASRGPAVSRYGGGTNLFLAPRYATGSLPIGQYVADMKQKALTAGLTRADVRDASQRFATFPQLAALLNAMNRARVDMGNPMPRAFAFDAPDIWTPVDSTPAPTPTVPTPTTPTPTPTTPTTPTPAANPQVMWYDKDAWAANPTLKYLNGQWSENMFRTPSSRASYDPATGTTIQSAGSMNAGNMMDIDRDPVRRGMTESLLTRHNRSYEKELADAIANAPMGSASRYVKTG